MSNIDDRNVLGSEEMRELSRSGPFGGIQSELPISMIEELGFAAASNICFRLGRAIARPGIAQDSLVGTTTDPVTGFVTFFALNPIPFPVTPMQIAFKANAAEGGLYKYQAGVWTKVAGSSAFAPTLHPARDILGGTLCYSDGTFPVELFDGTTVTKPAGAPNAKSLCEIALHLVAGNTSLGPYNYFWSGVGDPTDWTSFSSGNNNYLSDLGPIIGMQALGQIGYGFHLNGIIQIIPTGVGTAPFAFEPLLSSNKGCLSTGLLTRFELGGVDCAAYATQGNIQVFNQTQSVGIGDAPISGRKRVGARQAIMADLYNTRAQAFTTLQNASGYDMVVTENMSGVPFKALWMLLNNVIWCYNLDEENWTRFFLGSISNPSTRYTTLGLLDFNAGDQLTGLSSIWPSLALSKANAVLKSDLSVPCEQSMSLTSGKITFDDVRHFHTIKKFRLRFTDLGTISYTITLTNEKGVSQTQVATLGTGTGDDLSYILSYSLPGLRFQYNISAPATAPFAVIELAPIYDIGGEQRGGLLDN